MSGLIDKSEIIARFMGRPTNECMMGDVLEKMAEQGQSVTLNYGEDNRLWECSWITSGKRFTSFAAHAEAAVAFCIRQVLLYEETNQI